MSDADTEMEQAEHEATVDREIRYLRAKDEARTRYAAEVQAAEPDDTPALLVDGATFLLDIPEGVPAIWGRGTEVLWAQGEALLIAGPPGVGKTTLISHVLVSMLGIGGTHVLGLPVAPARKVLYLAMDRPQQIARALSRHVRAEHRDTLAEHLVVWKGPPPADLAKHPGALLTLAEQAEADVVVIDSLKDAAIGLSEDEVGAGYNRARQLLLAHGVEVVELHHTRKPGAGTSSTPSLSDVYGSTWITSGAGSVLLLSGEPGDPIVDMRHLKQPAGEVGPYRLLHDQDTGAMTVEHSTDLYAIAAAAGAEGITAKRAAVAMFEKDTPSRAQIEKVRRKLDRLVKAGLLVREDGQEGPEGGTPAAVWHLVGSSHAPEDQSRFDPTGSSHGQSRSETDRQVRAVTGGISGESSHAPEKQSRSDSDPQVRAVTGAVTAVTHPAVTNCTPPLRGGRALPEEEENRPTDDPLDAALDVATRLLGGTVLTP